MNFICAINRAPVWHLFCSIYHWQWSCLSWREKQKYSSRLQEKEPSEDCLISVIWQSAASWKTLLFSTAEQRQFFKAMDICTTNDVLQHFHHDQTQKKSQTYLWVSLFGWSHVWAAEVEGEACGKAGQERTRTGTNQNRHPAVSACKMAPGAVQLCKT